VSVGTIMLRMAMGLAAFAAGLDSDLQCNTSSESAPVMHCTLVAISARFR
jgi:hypothetical protein